MIPLIIHTVKSKGYPLKKGGSSGKIIGIF